MSGVTNLEFDALLLPFPGKQPAGTDPRDDASAQSLYYRLRDARAEARALEREADGDGSRDNAPPLQWRQVRDLAQRILSERAKDLEASAWLTEALVRESGFAGLCAGANLMAGLLDVYWDQGLFPVPDEDGVATLVAPIGGLTGGDQDGSLPQPLRKQAMFVRPDGNVVTFWQFMQAEDVASIGDAARKKQRLAGGALALAEVERDARIAGAAHFGGLRDEIDAAITAWDRLTAGLELRADVDAPSTRRMRVLLETLLQLVSRYAPARVAAPAPEPAQADPDGVMAAPGPASAGDAGAARPVSRNDMLLELAKIADYFREAEPQSPISLTLDEAVRRARLTWPELLHEIVPNDDARNAMLTQLGIRPIKPE